MNGRTRDILNQLIGAMEEMSDEDRMQIIREIRENYCLWCGSTSADTCTCMRDD